MNVIENLCFLGSCPPPRELKISHK